MSTVERIRVRQQASDRAVLLYPHTSTGQGLDGVQVGLRLRHSAAEDRWYLWLVDLAGAEFAGPAKLVRGLDLFLPWKHDPRVPPGQLFVRGEEATKDTIDITSTLCYRPIAFVTEPYPGANA